MNENKPRQYVIVGGGVAGICAAKAIRDLDEHAVISIYGNEAGLPYNRVKLSKGLFTDLHSDKVLIKKEKWFQQNNIQVITNTEITSIDASAQSITTGDGQQIQYDKLLLCTGAVNRKLELEGAQLPQVHQIRTRQDADHLKDSLQPQDSICVIGGGIQGIETAWSLHQAGYKVTIVEQAPRLMARQLDEKAAQILTKQIVDHGCEVITGQAVCKILGEGSVQGIELGDGTIIPCQHVVYSIGIIPNADLAKQSGIHVDRGILVDEHMQTNLDHIYAAGDVVQFDNKIEGLWNTAMEQGKIAGSNMAHDSASYQSLIPMTVFTAFDMPLFSIGQIDKEPCQHPDCGTETVPYKQVFKENDAVCGAIVFDTVLAAAPYKEAIEQALPITTLLEV